MRIPTIGIDADDLRLPVKDALRSAAEMQFHTVELPAVTGEVAPSNLSASGRRHLASYVGGLGLQVSALTADMPRLRLTDPQTVDERIDQTCRIIDLAADLGVPIVTASVAALTHPQTGEPSPMGIEALRRIGEFADTRGTIYAIRPSYDTPQRLAKVFDAVRCPALRIGLDPAALVMTGADPVATVERFAEQIRLLHARDATAGIHDRPGQETRLGEGDVDLRRLIHALRDADYSGAYIVRRINSRTTLRELQFAREVLANHLVRAAD